ncbi:hypothetical protein [Novipirellula caenicola]|uniref:Secreted protein n=1 Tax=Novipirellula caenicola TaxID=1536901 RepID=A0ABP9VQG9_9BACT
MPNRPKTASIASQTPFLPRLQANLPLRILLFGSVVFAATSYVFSQPPSTSPPTDAFPASPEPGSPETPGFTEPGLSGGQAEKVLGVVNQANARPYQVGAAGDMIGFSHSDGSGSQTITLIDTGKSWMAVYHIDRSGTIRLMSSRPIDADFSLQLNATSPLPEEIRQMNKGKK